MVKGIMGRFVSCAILTAPILKGKTDVFDVLLSLPSGNTPTISPFFRYSTAVSRAFLSFPLR
jgi:hypothetical protein